MLLVQGQQKVNARQLASGLSMPIGFKNSTNGNINRAIDAIVSCGEHTFLGINKIIFIYN